VIEVEGIHKSFGDREVLRGVDLHVDPRQAMVVLGPSGSGKSTLLRCVAALEPFQAGRITVDGELIGYREEGGDRRRLKEGVLARQRSEIGMIFQSFNLFPHMTALQNVMLGLVHVRKQPKDAARATALEWLGRVGLGDRGDAFPAQLSGGQQQRVAIARACATQPKVLLFDEVTSALDPELVGEVLEVIKDLSTSGVTMLVVTHEVPFAREVAHEVVFMDEGVIVERGRPDDILGNPRTERLQTFLKRYSNVSMRTTERTAAS
jgi:polar amino acid transport system ATP-binding protein